jgi:protein-L-isoaspartate(D-aspartate) O-methyltransferase
VHGAPAAGPYDAILIEGAVQTIPAEIAEQLKEGGRLLVCENAHMRPGHNAGLARAKYYEKREGVLSARVLFDTSVSLLPGFAAVQKFTFN